MVKINDAYGLSYEQTT